MSGGSQGLTTPTVAEYAIQRLLDLGVRSVFGIPGDYAFPLFNAIQKLSSAGTGRLTYINSANELNMAYAADGYARVFGCAVCVVTYGVGALSALNAIMGSNAEHLPVFLLAGAPSSRLGRTSRVIHHTLGDTAAHDRFLPIMETAVCASAVLGPDNAVSEMERVIKIALAERKPAYISVQQDMGSMPIAEEPIKGVPLAQVPLPYSSPTELDAAVDAIIERLAAAHRPVMLPSFMVARYGLQGKVLALLEATGMPFATTGIDKAVISEQHPQFMGMYRGGMSKSQAVKDAVHRADLLLNVGDVLFDDISTGFGTTELRKERMITIAPHRIEVSASSGEVHAQGSSFGPVWMGDLLDQLIERLGQRQGAEISAFPRPQAPPVEGAPEDIVSYLSLKSRVERFLQPNDVLFVETGISSVVFAEALLPEGAQYHNQTLWGSIGWATPAAFGAALADSSRRVILVTGDGSHQMTANELGVMGRYEHNLIQIVVNNGLHGIEEFLEHNGGKIYNVIAPWHYAQVPAAMGCKEWLCGAVCTNVEFEEALEAARRHPRPAYIEVMMKGALMVPMSPEMVEMAYLVHTPTAKTF